MSNQRVGIIGGTGLYQMDGVEITEERTVETPFGATSDTIRLGHYRDVALAFLPRHGRHHHLLPHEINFRANMWALKSLDVEQIVSVSAVGTMKEAIAPGDFVIIDQLIDRTHARPTTFFGDGIAAHVAFADPICPEIAKRLADGEHAVKTTVHRGGTYLCIEGPMFSTRAESLLFRSWGVDVIGMTNYQEAKLAREAEICYATVALATDYDCWHAGEAAVDSASVMAMVQKNAANVQQLIRSILPSLPRPRTCRCATALKDSIITPAEHVTAETKARLKPIIGRYVAC